jgi:hypothetical protein
MEEAQAWGIYLQQQVFQTRAGIAAVRKQGKPLEKRNEDIKHEADGGNLVCTEEVLFARLTSCL